MKEGSRKAPAGRVREPVAAWESVPTLEGAGVRLRRAFGARELGRLDPFLLLDDFRSSDPRDYEAGFPWHPHRGIETVTYVLEGEVEHRDSLGNGGVIGPGAVQWMSAGRGILHQEMPRGSASGRLLGFQLWLNLPASRKMSPPRYRELPPESLPVVRLPGGGSARVVAGELKGALGPIQDESLQPGYLDVSLPPRSRAAFPVPAGLTAFAYVIEGAGRFGPEGAPPRGNSTLALLGDGDLVAAEAGDLGARFLLVSGRPLGEPVAWSGPIVMNTEEEIRRAHEDLRRGTFLDPGP